MATCGTKDAAQCFDVACEEDMTATVFRLESVTLSVPLDRTWKFSVQTRRRFCDVDHEAATKNQEQVSKHLIVKHLATVKIES